MSEREEVRITPSLGVQLEGSALRACGVPCHDRLSGREMRHEFCSRVPSLVWGRRDLLECSRVKLGDSVKCRARCGEW